MAEYWARRNKQDRHQVPCRQHNHQRKPAAITPRTGLSEGKEAFRAADLFGERHGDYQQHSSAGGQHFGGPAAGTAPCEARIPSTS